MQLSLGGVPDFPSASGDDSDWLRLGGVVDCSLPWGLAPDPCGVPDFPLGRGDKLD